MPVELRFGPVAHDSCLNSDCTLKTDGQRARPDGFGTIWTAVALDLVGWGIVLPILPLYAERFTEDTTLVGLLVASFSLMQLVFAPVLGRLSDRYGRKPVLVASLLGTAVGSLLMGVAGSLWLLFLGRIVDGVSGSSISVAQAAVVDVAPAAQRARLLGLLSAAFGVGFVAGPALGGLSALGGPKLPFLVAGTIAFVNALVALRRLPETNPAITGAREVVEDAEPAPSRTGLRQLVVLNLVWLSAFSAFEATFALLGERRFGLTEASIAAVFVAIGVFHVGVQTRFVQPMVERTGERGALRAGLVSLGLGLVVLSVARSWLVLVPALALITVGSGLATPTITALISERGGAGRRGTTLGVAQSAGALARVVGPIAGGFLFQHVGVPAPSIAGAALVGTALLLGSNFSS
ncbi:MAG: transporter, family, tetracycline resistance protein [Actinomycetota bacterium]|nr:transporter, family, tetracycline resistance protein [Actinomycetota bacterium]